jgi:WD40 repeat protein
VWNVNDGSCKRTMRDGRLTLIYSVAFSPDGRNLVAAGLNDDVGDRSETGTIAFWVSDDAFSQRAFACIVDSSPALLCMTAISYSPDGRYLASGSEGGVVKLWDGTDRSCVAVLRGHILKVTSVSFSPNGNLLVSGSDDGSIRLWSVQDKICVLVLPNHHADGVYSVTFSPDGQTLASGGGDETVRLWNPCEERNRDKQFDWKDIVRLWNSGP